ncbi:MAG: DMT family transporter [Alphaproteobacteria bacterium]|nr:DMT family transporter [Alphaproteobacteria bacterium]
MKISAQGWLADALVLLAALIWGVAFYFQKTAMLHLGPLLFLGLRATIAAMALAPFAMREQGEPGITPIALLGGVLFFMAASIQQIGIVEATVTNTGFLTALYVVVTPVMVWVWKRKAPGRAIWLGTVLAFAGTWALSGGSFAAFSRGDWLIATSAIFWSSFIITTGESGKYGRPLTYVSLQFTVVALLSLGAAFLFETVSADAIGKAIVPVLYVGFLSSALTFALLAVSLRHVPPARAAILLSLETVFAAIAGAVMLGERLAIIGWMGAALMFAAFLVVQLGKRENEPD